MARTLPAARRQRHTSGPATDGPWPMAVMIVVAVGLGATLWVVAGPPTEAWRLPDLATVRATLTASEIADRDLIAVATAVAWLALGYLAVTVVLRCMALAADRVTRGARWARIALRLSNLVTVPALRRIVDGGVAGTLLVASWMPATARVAAADPVVSLPVPAVAQVGGPAPAYAEQAPVRAAVTYTVVPGDDLWGIARRMYGDGSRYVELFEANRDRVMSDGERFTDPRVIRVGWALHLPLPSPRIDVESGVPTYRTLPGDHLWGIAERFLGDGFRWTELWEANRDREMDAGWRFTNPNLIYPGWEIALPVEVLTTAPAVDERVVPVEPEAPATPAAATEATPEANADPLLGSDSAADAGDGTGITWDWPSVPRPLVITAAGFAVLGSAVLFVSRLRRQGLLQVPSFGRREAWATGDAGRVALVGRAVASAIAETGYPNARLLLIHETDRHLTCTVDWPAGDGEAMTVAVAALSERLGCAVESVLVGAQRVDLVLTGMGETTLRQGSAADAGSALMLPVGTEASGAILYLNLAGAGSVAVTGTDGDRRQLLHAWLATLAATAGADELALRADMTAAALAGDDLALPHFGGTDRPETDALLDELEDVITSREGTNARRPQVAFLDHGTAATRADAIVPYAPQAGVYLVSLAPSDGASDRSGGVFGAGVRLGLDGTEGDVDGDGFERGSVRLTVGSGDPMWLDPVLVRRDTSPRWRAAVPPSGEIGAGNGVGVAGTTVAPIPEDEGDGQGPARTVADTDPAAPFDWHRALFEPFALRNGAHAAGACEASLGTECDPVVAPALYAPTHAGAEGLPTEVAPDGDDEPEPDTAPVADAAVQQPEPGEAPEAVGTEPFTAAVESAIEAEHQPAHAPSEPAVSAPATDPTAGVLAGEPARQHAASPPVVSHSPIVRQQPLWLAEPPAGDGVDRAESEALIRVRCFGAFEVSVAGTPVASWRYEKGREFVALLVAHGGAPVARRVVADLLWPELLWDSSVKHMMDNAATTARKAIRMAADQNDLQPITLARDRYQFQPGILRSDLDEFDAAVRRAAGLPASEALEQYARAVALYRGDVMQSETFEWLDRFRPEYRRRFLDAARAAAGIAAELGDLERAGAFFAAGMERAPTDEVFARGLMRCRSALGDPSGVHKVYQVLAEALQRELGIPGAVPSAETRALLDELVTAATVG